MRRTLHEVYRVCQKATEGAGAPPGLDVEAGRAAAWLASRALPALDDLARELELLGREDAGCCFEQRPGARELDARDKAGALIAPLLVDRLVEGGREAAFSLRVLGLSSPLFLLPAAAGYARPGCLFYFSLKTQKGQDVGILVRGEDELTVEASAETDISALCGTRFDIEAYCSSALPASTMRVANRVLLDPNGLSRARSTSLAHGVTVDENAWSRLARYAERVLVPATDTSRCGAGALGSDNE